MTNALLVVWRESLEAWLIVAMLSAWLAANNEGRRGRIALAGGVLAGIALAAALGWAMLDIRDDLTGDALEAFQIAALIADISHQTRTPIANLLLYGSLLEESPLSPAQQEQLRALRGQAEKLAFLMEALVKSSRLDAGVLTLSPAEVAADMRAFLEERRAQLAEGRAAP